MLDLKINQTNFVPGDVIAGNASWKSDVEQDRIEVRLIWYTEGKGDQDVDIAMTETIESPGPTGNAAFQFIVPSRPLSFSGKLISLMWAVEAICFPQREATRIEIVISRDGNEIKLDQSFERPKRSKFSIGK